MSQYADMTVPELLERSEKIKALLYDGSYVGVAVQFQARSLRALLKKELSLVRVELGKRRA